jgi:ABC-type Zn uptake system ZnuABC Zn-binding protein ZnuA
MAKLKAAALLVRIGLDHEPWLARVLRSVNDPRLARGSPPYLDASQKIQLLQAETPRVRGERGVHVHGFGNTHYWLDPENARPITELILEALSRLSPADGPFFEANRKRFLQGLDAALARWSRALAPYHGTRVVVVHETWPYFAQRFGLVVVAAVEPTPGVPPSPSAVATLTQRMRDSGLKLLIAEPYSNASVVKQVADRSGARVVTLIPSVGGDPEARDYIGLFDLNVKRLTEALTTTR